MTDHLKQDDGQPIQHKQQKNEEELKNLEVVFKKLYTCMLSLIKTTAVQQRNVQSFIDKAGKDRHGEKNTIVDNIVDLQTACYTQTMPLHDSVMELYHTLQRLLQSCDVGQFEIDFPSLTQNNQQKSANRDNYECDDVSDVLTDIVTAKKDETITPSMKTVPQLQMQFDELNSENKTLKSETKILNTEYNESKPAAEVYDTVQLLCECNRNAAQNVEGEFSRRLKDKFDDRSIDILTVKTDTIDACKKLIVLCFNTSRSSSDAESAIKHIKNPGNTVLVLIQNKDVHALKNKSSAIRKNKKCKALAGIFDLGYLKETGIYKCNMNTNTMTEICGFIKNIQ